MRNIIIVCIIVFAAAGCKPPAHIWQSTRMECRQVLAPTKETCTVCPQQDPIATTGNRKSAGRVPATINAFLPAVVAGHHPKKHDPVRPMTGLGPLKAAIDTPATDILKRKIDDHRQLAKTFTWTGAGLTVASGLLFVILVMIASQSEAGLGLIFTILAISSIVGLILGVLLLLTGIIMFIKNDQDKHQLNSMEGPDEKYQEFRRKRRKLIRILFIIGITAFVLSVIAVFVLNFVVLGFLLEAIIHGAAILLAYTWFACLPVAPVLWLVSLARPLQ